MLGMRFQEVKKPGPSQREIAKKLSNPKGAATASELHGVLTMS